MKNSTQNPAAKAGQSNLYYFIAWRWHFYAGLYVIPFLITLAVTGLLMLWISSTTEINGERGVVDVTANQLTVSQLVDITENMFENSKVDRFIAPRGEDRVAVMRAKTNDDTTTVVLDPYSGAILDSFPWRAGLYDLAADIHGTLLLGKIGDYMIEIAASLGIIMVVSGLYLHWPRGSTPLRSILIPNIAAKGRAFWKSMHGVLGFWMSLVMIIFLISGLSWAGIWGEKMVQAWNTFPAEKWDAPLSDVTHKDANTDDALQTPWALEQTPMPISGSLEGTPAVTAPVTADKIDAFAKSLGFNGRYQIAFPKDDEAVWTISHDSMSNDGPNPMADRTIHIDQYTGKILADVSYSDYSPYAKMMAWGIAFHEGDLGSWNLVLNTLFCASIIFISVSGLIMWWKRRPEKQARIAAPPKPQLGKIWTLGALIVVVLGLLFPLGGAMIGAILILDYLVISRLPKFKKAVS